MSWGYRYLSKSIKIFPQFSFILFLQPLLVSLVFLLKILEHLVLNLGESNGGVHLTTSLRLFWKH